MLTFLALACTPPEETHPRHTDPTDGVPSETSETGTSGETAATGDTGPVEPPVDCSNLPDGSEPLTVSVLPIVTTEDFDFDAQGFLIYSDWTQMKAVDMALTYTPIGPGVHDTRGIQILDNGDIVAAYYVDGVLGMVDRDTGAGTQLVTGLGFPNALEVGDGNEIFVSETSGGPKVRSFDLDTLTPTNVASGFGYPNGMALNNEQDVLYVADNTTGVYAVPKNDDGTWGAKELVFTPPPGESYDGIEVDVCGNVYTVEFYSGKLVRFNPDTGERVLLYDINDPQEFLYNSIRWGSNRGGWRRDVLYVTDRNKIFAIEVGVEGRRQPVDAMQ